MVFSILELGSSILCHMIVSTSDTCTGQVKCFHGSSEREEKQQSGEGVESIILPTYKEVGFASGHDLLPRYCTVQHVDVHGQSKGAAQKTTSSKERKHCKDGEPGTLLSNHSVHRKGGGFKVSSSAPHQSYCQEENNSNDTPCDSLQTRLRRYSILPSTYK